MSNEESAAEGGSHVVGKIKWFNPEKGYGFVIPDDGTPDAFLHISVLKDAQLRDAPEGSVIKCEIEQAQKGRQVVKIVELDTSTAVKRGARD